jgi:hypothetical protein
MRSLICNLSLRTSSPPSIGASDLRRRQAIDHGTGRSPILQYSLTFVLLLCCAVLVACGDSGAGGSNGSAATAASVAAGTTSMQMATSLAVVPGARDPRASKAGPSAKAFTAAVVNAPADGATLSGIVTLEVQGSEIGNVELLPATGYVPKWGVFTNSGGGTVARLELDTRVLPNGPVQLRINAFDRPGGDPTASEIVVMPARTWNISNAASTPFTAAVVTAPADGATVSGIVALEVHGSAMANVELLLATGYTPKLGVFNISANGTVAQLNIDTQALPNGPIQLRISAFNRPAGDPTASEIVAIPARTWTISNALPAPPAEPAPTAVNAVPITVGGGPLLFNTALVSVTICRPNTTVCQTIDKIKVDTGSVGLRIDPDVIRPELALPAVTDDNGNPVGACALFGARGVPAAHFRWGPVKYADVKIGAMTAANLPVQIVGSPDFPSIPEGCTNVSPVSAVNVKYINGLLGIGTAAVDCGAACVNLTALSPSYFGCASTGCSRTPLTVSKQLIHPVTRFGAGYDNGTLIQLPPVDVAGAEAVQGNLIFGIGSQPNNQMGNAKVFKPAADGVIPAAYNGRSIGAVMDSGAPPILIYDESITKCAGGSQFCPTQPTTISVLLGTGNDRDLVSLIIGAPSSNTRIEAQPVAAVLSSQSSPITFGLPFYYGRSVFTAIDGQQTPKGAGPYIAYF